MNDVAITRSHFNDWMVPVFAPANFILVRGEGSRLWDQNDKEYIDFAGGIAVNALGHAHPVAVNALTEQAQKLWHIGNGYTNEPVLRLAKQLVDSTFADKVFFCNSGAEANEAALKIDRKIGLLSGNPNKNHIPESKNPKNVAIFNGLSEKAKIPSNFEIKSKPNFRYKSSKR